MEILKIAVQYRKYGKLIKPGNCKVLFKNDLTVNTTLKISNCKKRNVYQTQKRLKVKYH
jgi:hypothetical protein